MPLPGLLRLKGVTVRVKLAIIIVTKMTHEHSSAGTNYK